MTSREGAPHQHTVATATLLVVVKANCDGCRSFYEGELGELESLLPVIIVTRNGAAGPDFATAVHPIYDAPELVDALDVRGPPVYLVVAPSPGRVVVEGVAFSPQQVLHEIATFL